MTFRPSFFKRLTPVQELSLIAERLSDVSMRLSIIVMAHTNQALRDIRTGALCFFQRRTGRHRPSLAFGSAPPDLHLRSVAQTSVRHQELRRGSSRTTENLHPPEPENKVFLVLRVRGKISSAVKAASCETVRGLPYLRVRRKSLSRLPRRRINADNASDRAPFRGRGIL